MNWDDNSRLTQTVDFAWSEIDEHCFGVVPRDEEPSNPLPPDADERAIVMLMKWVWGGLSRQPITPTKLDRGFTCRSAIACRCVLRDLHSISLTELANLALGKEKQSVGRFVEDFKRKFPQLIRYMENTKQCLQSKSQPKSNRLPRACVKKRKNCSR